MVLPRANILHRRANLKLQISNQGFQIKVEVNQTNRGVLSEPLERVLCDKAQDQFEVFCSITVVSMAQLYGGKICAALDRQHPRDLFDVKLLLENEGFTQDIKVGFILSMLGSNRPTHELLQPNLLDQQPAFENQFSGITTVPFTYEDFEATRKQLISEIADSLKPSDKQFLIGFTNLEPDWSIYDFEKFPSIQWKIQNLMRLKELNPDKHLEQFELLKKVLSDS